MAEKVLTGEIVEEGEGFKASENGKALATENEVHPVYDYLLGLGVRSRPTQESALRSALSVLASPWLRDRYGSLEEAFSAWGSVKHPDDNIATGCAGLFDAWHMTTDGSRTGGQDKVKRIGDQVRFLTEHQRQFYTSIVKYFKEDLRVGSLISPSNWHVTDGQMLDALERYTYTAGDVIDRHGYFGGKHEGEGSNYSVRVGHTFANRAAVKNPEHLPLQVFQIDGYPHIISEIGWTNPNRFRADFTFLSSAYGALQGLDGIFFFAVNSANS
ncbi:MAG: hypothetical protein IIA51_10220 [Chloroflexi bacterium]|nr:hypothetical protein [Chloroflexota bacterium]